MQHHGKSVNRSAYAMPQSPLQDHAASSSSSTAAATSSLYPPSIGSSSSRLNNNNNNNNTSDPSASSSSSSPSQSQYLQSIGIPDNLKTKFKDQLSALLATNESLSNQVTDLRANRGVKIDNDQFKAWESKIDGLHRSLERSEKACEELTTIKMRQGDRIVFLEDEVRRLSTEVAKKSAKKWGDEDDQTSSSPRSPRPKPIPTVVDGVSTQTKHSGPIPPPLPKAPTTCSTGTDVYPPRHDAFDVGTQTDAPPLPSPRTGRKVPKATSEELDLFMLLSELDLVRESLEGPAPTPVGGTEPHRRLEELPASYSPSSSSTAPVIPLASTGGGSAWAQVVGSSSRHPGSTSPPPMHAVVGALSALKQRAMSFRFELEVLRRKNAQLSKQQTSGGGNASFSSPPSRKTSTLGPIAPDRPVAEERAIGPAPVTNFAFVTPSQSGGHSQRLLPSMSSSGGGGGGGGGGRGNGGGGTGGGGAVSDKMMSFTALNSNGSINLTPNRPGDARRESNGGRGSSSSRDIYANLR